MREAVHLVEGADARVRVRVLPKLGHYYKMSLQKSKANGWLTEAADIARAANLHDQSQQIVVSKPRRGVKRMD